MEELIEGDYELRDFVKTIDEQALGSKINQALKQPNGFQTDRAPGSVYTNGEGHKGPSRSKEPLLTLLEGSTDEQTILLLQPRVSFSALGLWAQALGTGSLLEVGDPWLAHLLPPAHELTHDYHSELHDNVFKKRKRKIKENSEWEPLLSLRVYSSRKRCSNAACKSDKRVPLKKTSYACDGHEPKPLAFCTVCYVPWKKMHYCTLCLQIYFTEDLGDKWAACGKCKRQAHRTCLSKARHCLDAQFQNYYCVYCKEELARVAARNERLRPEPALTFPAQVEAPVGSNSVSANRNFSRVDERKRTPDSQYHLPFYFGLKFKMDCYPKYYQCFDTQNWEEKVKLVEVNLSTDLNKMVQFILTKDTPINGLHHEKYEIIKKEIKSRSDADNIEDDKFKLLNGKVNEQIHYDEATINPYKFRICDN